MDNPPPQLPNIPTIVKFPYSNRPDTGQRGLRTAAYIKPKHGDLNILKTTSHIFLKLAAKESVFYWKWLKFRENSNAECLCGCV